MRSHLTVIEIIIVIIVVLLLVVVMVVRISVMKNSVFWDVTPCGSCKNRRVGGT
jgi:hypothetical protein